MHSKTVRKKRTMALAGLFFSLTLLMAMPALAGKVVDQDALYLKAMELGMARVIVTIDVNNYKQLLSSSLAFKVGEESQKMSHAVESADAALAGAIESSADAVLSKMGTAGFEYHFSFKTVPAMVMSVSPEALAELEALPEVVSVVEDGLTPVPETEDVGSDGIDRPQLSDSVPLVGADDAWAKGYTGSGWYVAVLDTGVRTSHEFFNNKTFVEACYNTTSTAYTATTTCPNGTDTQTGSGAAWPPNISGADHGTHVAGIATGYNAQPTSGEPPAGVAKNANLIAVNVFTKFTSTSYCGSSTPCVLSWNSDQVLGLEYVYSLRGQLNIASVNMSLGGGQYTAHCDTDSRKTAIDNLKAAGIATTISTGNEYYCGSVSAPGCISSAVAVGSTSKSDVRESYSNWDPNLQDLFAPGGNITSSETASDSDYGIKSGTSMAAPHVAGAWAIMRQAYPTDSVDSILNKLQSSGKTINVTNCSTTTGTNSRIDLSGAVPSDTPSLCWQNAVSGAFGVETYNGTTRLAWHYMNSYATSWKVKALGDFNGDGKVDLLWRNNGTGAFGWETYNGTTRLGWYYINRYATSWDIKGVGDYNNDGKLDILWRNSSTGAFGWETYNGTTRLGWYYINKYATSWNIRGAGDFNGDRKMDILWRNSSTGAFGWETYNGTTRLAWNYLNKYSIVWDIRGTDDFNGDGKLDILWRNNTYGTFGWETYNGTSYIGWNYINKYSTSWDLKGVGAYN